MAEVEGLFGFNVIAKPRAEVIVVHSGEFALCVQFSKDLHLLEIEVLLLLSTNEFRQLLSCYISSMLLI